MKKISITTVYKGFNYGSSLQAYASKLYLASMGYEPEIIVYKDGLLKGRDFRFKKLFVMFLRTFWRPSLFKKTFLTYKNSFQKQISEDAKKAFLNFELNRLQVKKYSWHELKVYAGNDDVLACVCGSDQIWNATNIYVDPIYYLKFAPKEKRVAYAPSFGKSEVPQYNKEIIKKNVSRFDYLSVREEQGVSIIKNLTGREVPALIDPTLLVDKNNWTDILDNFKELKYEKYILLYFLDTPSGAAIKHIKRLVEVYQCSIICIPYKHSEFDEFKSCENIGAGPLEFIHLIANAVFVCTDSFHGMAFSVNFNIPFLIFNRIYGAASDQSSRIVSLLEKLDLQERFIYETEVSEKISIEDTMTFENSNRLLAIERQKSKEYLQNAFYNIENKVNYGEYDGK